MAANEARVLGRGVISEVCRAHGLSRKAIAKGIKEIEVGIALPQGRVRQPGTGRKKISDHDPRLAGPLDQLIDPDTRGDPETPLLWTCNSTRTLAAQLTRQKHPISHMKVAQLLHLLGYSLQGNRKTEEGSDHQHGGCHKSWHPAESTWLPPSVFGIFFQHPSSDRRQTFFNGVFRAQDLRSAAPSQIQTRL